MTKETDQKSREKKEDDSEENMIKKSISIKGVSTDIYKRINEIARETGKTIGEITNEAFKFFVSTVDGARQVSKNFVDGISEMSIQTVSNFKELELNGKDLREFSRKVSFRNINRLVFKNIKDDDIRKYVDSFVHIEELVLPRDISKALVLQKCNFVSKITQI